MPEIIEKIVKKYLIPRLKNHTIFTFRGPLGAGKTTLIKAFLQQCGVTQVVTSPTFTYVNTYTNNKGQKFNHFDLYRLPSLESFLELGFDEYFYESIKTGNSWNLIEWPEIIKSLLKDKNLKQTVYNIYLNYNANNSINRTSHI